MSISGLCVTLPEHVLQYALKNPLDAPLYITSLSPTGPLDLQLERSNGSLSLTICASLESGGKLPWLLKENLLNITITGAALPDDDGIITHGSEDIDSDNEHAIPAQFLDPTLTEEVTNESPVTETFPGVSAEPILPVTSDEVITESTLSEAPADPQEESLPEAFHDSAHSLKVNSLETGPSSVIPKAHVQLSSIACTTPNINPTCKTPDVKVEDNSSALDTPKHQLQSPGIGAAENDTSKDICLSSNTWGHSCKLCSARYYSQTSLSRHVVLTHKLSWENYAARDDLKSTNICLIETKRATDHKKVRTRQRRPGSKHHLKQPRKNGDTDIHDIRRSDDVPIVMNTENSCFLGDSNSNATKADCLGDDCTDTKTRDVPQKLSSDTIGKPTEELPLPGTTRNHNSVFACPVCRETFASHRVLLAHVTDRHRRLKRSSDIIQEVEKARAAAMTPGAVNIKCPVCAVKFPGQRVLRHIKLAHPNHPQLASLLENAHAEYVKLRGVVNKHKQTAQSGIKISCDYCGKEVKKTSMSNHLNYHCKQKKDKRPMFACSKCGFMSVFKERYTKHVQTAHSQDASSCFTCEDCGKVFKSNSGFLQHRQRHHGAVTSRGTTPKTHDCSECGKSFYSQIHLQRHMTVHTKEALHQCTECNKSYRNHCTLVTHQRRFHHTRREFTSPYSGEDAQTATGYENHKCSGSNQTAAVDNETVSAILSSTRTGEMGEVDLQNNASDSVQVVNVHDLPEGAFLQLPELPLGDAENIYLVIEQGD